MALVESMGISLKTQMPHFKLKDPSGQDYCSQDLFGSKGLLVAFTCNHCPYAIAVWPRLIRLARWAEEHGIKTVAINPNIHPDYPEDAPEKMVQKIKEWNIAFPYLVDDTQEVARSFRAQCTPDIYLMNQNNELIYHGRIDNNWQNEAAVTKEELKEAIRALVEEEELIEEQYPSMGCSIKWNL